MAVTRKPPKAMEVKAPELEMSKPTLTEVPAEKPAEEPTLGDFMPPPPPYVEPPVVEHDTSIPEAGLSLDRDVTVEEETVVGTISKATSAEQEAGRRRLEARAAQARAERGEIE